MQTHGGEAVTANKDVGACGNMMTGLNFPLSAPFKIMFLSFPGIE